MEENDAEAALFVLAAPLEWWDDVSPRQRLPEYFTGVIRKAAKEMAGGHLACHLFELEAGAPRYDADGNPQCCVLNVHFKAASDALREEEREMKAWYFPCQTVAEAKAVCERFALTGDHGDLDRRGRCWYSLEWEGSTATHRNARVRSMDTMIVRYDVSFQTGFSLSFREGLFHHYWIAGYYDNRGRTIPEKPGKRSLYSRSPRRYKTMRHAQAACERHHWTGNWE